MKFSSPKSVSCKYILKQGDLHIKTREYKRAKIHIIHTFLISFTLFWSYTYRYLCCLILPLKIQQGRVEAVPFILCDAEFRCKSSIYSNNKG